MLANSSLHPSLPFAPADLPDLHFPLDQAVLSASLNVILLYTVCVLKRQAVTFGTTLTIMQC